MNVTLFTDTIMCRDARDRPFPLRDQFVHFIAPLGGEVGHLTLVSRCRDAADDAPAESREYLTAGESLSYVPLPFYENTEDCYRRFPRLLARSLPRIWRAIAGSDVVVLRVHHCLALVIAVLTLLRGRPLVAYWAGPPILESARRNYPGRSLRDRTARFVARLEHGINRWIARTASLNFFIDRAEFELMGAPERVEWIVPNLVPRSQVRKTAEVDGAGPPRIVFAGRLFRHKGIFDLLDAADRMQERGLDFVLHVAGQGPGEQAFRRAVRERGLADRVRLEGNLDWDALQELLATSHIFALPSYAEGLPKVLWEAWAAGMAVVISDVGAIGDHVVDGENGLLVRPGRPAQLADALARLARDERLRTAIAAGGLATARRHTHGQAVRTIAAGLRSVMPDRAAAPPSPAAGKRDRPRSGTPVPAAGGEDGS